MKRVSIAPTAQGLGQLADHLLAAERLEEAVDSTTMPVLVHDGVHIKHANRSLARWLGYDSREILQGADLRVLSEEEDHRSLLAAMSAVSLGTHIQRFVEPDGEVVLGNVLVRGVASGDNRRLYLTLIEPTSSTLRSSNLLCLLEEAVDHLQDIVFITEADPIDDVGRRIVFVNRIFTLITGYELNDVLGKTPSITIGEATDAQALKRIEQALTRRRPVHEELLKVGKHGDEYWVELDILPVYDDNGVHTHWVSVQRDITERRQLQQRFVENERLASIGLLSTQLAAEVRRPLGSAKYSLDWLAERLPEALSDSLAPEIRAGLLGALQEAQANTIRVSETMHHLRLLSESGQERLEPTDVSEVLDSAVELLLATSEVPAHFVRDYESVPRVIADSSRLMHVFHFALETRAAALLEERKDTNVITLRVRSLSEGVRVSIEDAGVGVASEISEYLCTPFGPRGRDNDNQGLALFIANCMVRELGGRVEVRACDHGGCAIEVFLPAVPAFADEALVPAL